MICHRLLVGRVWCVKLWHVAGGTFVIPNAVMAFLFCEALFGVTWTFYAVATIRHYRDHAFQNTYFVIKALTWSPLWWGGWLTTFGLASAFPDALTYKVKGSKQKRLFVSPIVFNIACWAAPVVQMLGSLPLAIPGGRRYMVAAAHYDAWSEDVRVALESSVSSSVLDKLRTRGVEIWLEYTRAYWWYGTLMTCWCAWAMLTLLIYGPVGGHVLVRIRRQVKYEETKKRNAAGHAAAVNLEAGFADAFEGEGKEEQQICTTISTSRVFPPLRESASTAQKGVQPNKSPQGRRLHTLKRLLINLLVQYFGITIAIMLFFGASGIDAFGIYDAARYNRIMKNEDLSHLLAYWTMVFFASVIFLCMLQRSFDPSLSVDMSDEESPPIAYRSALSMFIKPFLERGGKASTKARGVDDHEGEFETSPRQDNRARPHSLYHIRRFSTASTLAAHRNDDEKQMPLGCVQSAAPQAPMFDASPVSNDSAKVISDDTMEMGPTATSAKSPWSTRFVVRTSSPHLADPATMQPTAFHWDYEAPAGASSPSKSLSRSRSLRKASATNLRQPGTVALRSTVRRPATAPVRRTAATSSLTLGRPLLDMEAKCFIPRGSQVAPGLVAEDRSQPRLQEAILQSLA